MQTLHRLKRVVQLIFDGEIYSLALIAAKNGFRRPQLSAPVAPPLVQTQNIKDDRKKAKAVNGT